ncbi:MAG: hypothetical protein KAH77_00970 [Thiomargarita sp.]|nr:hypothetical protein [Thiomargarita sp.]
MGAMTLFVDREYADLSMSRNTKVVCLRYSDGEEHRIGLYACKMANYWPVIQWDRCWEYMA